MQELAHLIDCQEEGRIWEKGELKNSYDTNNTWNSRREERLEY